MRRNLSAIAAAMAGLLLGASATLASAYPNEIQLPDGWQPEGIAAGPGTIAYAGSLADGGIARVDLLSGAVDDNFVPSATGPAVGLEYESGADRLWVAGGPSGEVRVYDRGRMAASSPLVASRSVDEPGAAGKAGWYARRTLHHLGGLFS